MTNSSSMCNSLIVIFYILVNIADSFGVPSSTKISTSSRNDLSMKIFDWKKRAAFKSYEVPDGK